MWKDDRDLQNPKLRKRKVWGYIRMPNGRKKRYYPNFIELSKPSKEVIDIFEKNDRESKLIVIKKKLDSLIKEMEKDAGVEDNKIGAMVDWYTKDQEALMSVGKRSRKKWRVNKEIKKAHGLTDTEFKIFEQRLNEKINKMGSEKDEKQ